MCQLLWVKDKKCGPTVPTSQILKSEGEKIKHSHMKSLKNNKYKYKLPS